MTTVANGIDWTPLRYHEAQQRYFKDVITKPKVLAAAGRRSGKTQLCLRKLILTAAMPKPWKDPKFLILMPTIAQVQRIWFQPLLQLLPKNWISRLSLVNMTVTTIFGSEIVCGSLEAIERFEGMGLDAVACDEICDCDPRMLQESIWPCLADRSGTISLLGRPKRSGRGFTWFRDQFREMAAAGGPAYTWRSSEIIPEAELVRWQQELSLSDYHEQFNGVFRDDAGGVLDSFGPENVRVCPYRPEAKIAVSSDFNVSPMCWVLAHIIQDRLEVFDEIAVAEGANTRQTLDLLWSRYGSHPGGWAFFGDASASSRATSAASSDLAQIVGDTRFLTAGRTIHYSTKNPPISDRVAACNRLACDAAGRRRWHVDPRCRGLLKAINSAVWKDGKRQLESNGSEHFVDAVGYVIFSKWPIISEINFTLAPNAIRIVGGRR